jgi:hypothetical protein
MNQPLTALAPYRPGHTRAMAAVIFLAAGIFLDVVGVAGTTVRLATGSVLDPSGEEITPYDLLELGLGLIQIIVVITTVVLFCMWLHRAHSNLPALGNPRQGLKYSPAWAVGSFFVPFVNLVVPYRATKEVWDKSDPAVGTDFFVPYSDSPAPAYFPLWWGFWIVSNIVNNIATRLYIRADSEAEMLVATWADLFGDLLNIPAAVFAILVVKGIDRRQDERSRRVSYVPNLPPPPPVFDGAANVPPRGGPEA